MPRRAFAHFHSADADRVHDRNLIAIPQLSPLHTDAAWDALNCYRRRVGSSDALRATRRTSRPAGRSVICENRQHPTADARNFDGMFHADTRKAFASRLPFDPLAAALLADTPPSVSRSDNPGHRAHSFEWTLPKDDLRELRHQRFFLLQANRFHPLRSHQSEPPLPTWVRCHSTPAETDAVLQKTPSALDAMT
jgi:hypothetical protein